MKVKVRVRVRARGKRRWLILLEEIESTQRPTGLVKKDTNGNNFLKPVRLFDSSKTDCALIIIMTTLA